MKKLSKCVVIILILTAMVAILFLGSCKTTLPAETTTAAASAETTTAAASSSFDDYLKIAAEHKEWPNSPGKAYKIAWANAYLVAPFAVQVGDSIIQQLKWAGVNSENITVLDNQLDPTIGSDNADKVLNQKPDLFIDYQFYADISNMIALKFEQAKIPLIAVDIPIMGAPFVAINNFEEAYKMGNFLADSAEKKWGSIDKVDLIIIGSIPGAGDVLLQRSEGAKKAFVDRYGSEILDKIKIINTSGVTDTANKACSELLVGYPEAKTLLIANTNIESTLGCKAAIEAIGIIKREDIFYAAIGENSSTEKLIRDGIIDMILAQYPEEYGDYVVPAAIAMLENKAVPALIKLPTDMVTKENVDKFYPAK